jgi:O-methyltransferase
MKNILRYIVNLLQKLLPQSQFERVLEIGLSIKRLFLRCVYGVKARMFGLAGLQAESDMMKSVLNVLPYSLVGIGGLEATYRMAKKVEDDKIPGAVVELGVARGGAAALLGKVCLKNASSNRKMWLFDSFEGLPEPTHFDIDRATGRTGDHIRPLPKGSCLGRIEEVRHLLVERFDLPQDRITFVKGWFQDTLPVFKNQIGPIALLRLDGDWYESTKVCLEHLYDLVTDGGVVLIDDYHSCFGCKKAVDEFIAERKMANNLVFDGRGGVYFIK